MKKHENTIVVSTKKCNQEEAYLKAAERAKRLTGSKAVTVSMLHLCHHSSDTQEQWNWTFEAWSE